MIKSISVMFMSLIYDEPLLHIKHAKVTLITMRKIHAGKPYFQIKVNSIILNEAVLKCFFFARHNLYVLFGWRTQAAWANMTLISYGDMGV